MMGKVFDYATTERLDTTTVTVGPPQCKHQNGTYRSIPARLFGRREVFVCRDCESVLDKKTMLRV